MAAFIVSEFVAHDSSSVGSLNHAREVSLKRPAVEPFGRYPRESGLVMLTGSSSGFDPKRTERAKRVCNESAGWPLSSHPSDPVI
jgi:hypothetical protein